MALSSTKVRFLLVLITGIYLVLGCVYLLVVPPWEAPDEPAHYRYIAFVADEGRLPTPDDAAQGKRHEISLYEWHHPPLYYLIEASIVRVGRALVGPEWGTIPLPKSNPTFAFTRPTHRFLPGPRGWNTQDGNLALALMRFVSLLLTVPIVPLAFWIGKEIFGSAVEGLTVATVVAFVPQHLFINASLRNDGLADLMATLVVGLLIFFTRQPVRARQWRWVALLGGALCLALLSKLTNVFLLVVTGAWAIALLARRVWQPRHCLALCSSVAVGFSPYLMGTAHGRALITYWMTSSQHRAVFRSDAFQFLRLLSTSFWARFGWMNVEVAAPLTILLTLILLAGVVLSVCLIFWPRIYHEHRAVTLIALTAIVTNLTFVLYFALLRAQPQGRFAFPVLTLLVAVAQLGFTWLSRFWGRWIPRVMILALLALNILSIVRLVKVYYG